MRVKWFLFAHAVGVVGKSDTRPLLAAHLALPPTSGNAAMPVCETIATHVPDAALSRGFMLACSACLAYSEIADGR